MEKNCRKCYCEAANKVTEETKSSFPRISTLETNWSLNPLSTQYYHQSQCNTVYHNHFPSTSSTTYKLWKKIPRCVKEEGNNKENQKRRQWHKSCVVCYFPSAYLGLVPKIPRQIFPGPLLATNWDTNNPKQIFKENTYNDLVFFFLDYSSVRKPILGKKLYLNNYNFCA